MSTKQNEKSTERTAKEEQGRVSGNDIFPSVDRHAYIKGIKGSRRETKAEL